MTLIEVLEYWGKAEARKDHDGSRTDIILCLNFYEEGIEVGFVSDSVDHSWFYYFKGDPDFPMGLTEAQVDGLMGQFYYNRYIFLDWLAKDYRQQNKLRG